MDGIEQDVRSFFVMTVVARCTSTLWVGTWCSLGLTNMSESFAELFEESFASKQIKPGSIITGIVVAINDDVVIVSAGLKSEAVIPK